LLTNALKYHCKRNVCLQKKPRLEVDKRMSQVLDLEGLFEY